MKKEHADRVITGAHNVNHTFGKFVKQEATCLDSLIIGRAVLYIYGDNGLAVCGACKRYRWALPTSYRSSRPFIGGIPSALLLCTDNIWTGMYFGILTVVLQQVDGNVIKPKVLGESIGLPSFWVMFSIVVGGGLFGFMGMILAVPVFALIWS